MLDTNVSFINHINEFSFILIHVLHSYDVESLLISMPLHEAIEYVCSHVYLQSDPPKYLAYIFRNLL